MKTLAILLFLTLVSSFSHAALISRNSIYGNNTITFDTSTYTEWLDPYITLGPGCCNNYYDVLNELKPGGKFYGFRFATKQEVEHLLYVSVGIDPVTASGSNTATPQDKLAIANALSLFDTTLGYYHGPDDFTKILDARFQYSGSTDTGRTILMYSVAGPDTMARYEVYDNENEVGRTDNVDPFGNWLIRVDEPPTTSLLGVSLVFLFWRLRRARR